MPGWATEGPALLFLQTSPPISHAGLRPGKCYLFLLELTAGEILTFTVCAVVVFGGTGGEAGRVCVVCVGQGRGTGGDMHLLPLLSLPTLPSPVTFPLVVVGVAPFALVAPLVGGVWIEDIGYE